MNSTEETLRLPSRAGDRLAPFHRWDRNFFLLWVALIWLGIVMGFGPPIASQIGEHQFLPFRRDGGGSDGRGMSAIVAPLLCSSALRSELLELGAKLSQLLLEPVHADR